VEIAGEYMDGMDARKTRLDADRCASGSLTIEAAQNNPEIRIGMDSARDTSDRPMVR